MRCHFPMAAAGSVIALLVVAAIVVLTFDFKSAIERRATNALGEPVAIGEFHLRIFPLRFNLVELNVGEPGSKADMHAGQVDATLAFWPLFSGQIIFSQLAVEDASATVERDAAGHTNWFLNRQHGAAAKQAVMPQILDLSLHKTQLLYRDPTYKTALTLHLETYENADGGERRLKVNGKGTYQGEPTTLSAVGGSILTLRDATAPYPIDGTFTSGDTVITVQGTVTDPVQIAGLDVKLSVQGNDGADLYRVVGIALPPTPPYKITTKLDRDGARWIFKSLKWKIGESDLAGEMTWDLTNSKPLLTGNLHAQMLDIDDLAGFIGAAPGKAKTPDEVKTAAADREKARRAQDMPAPQPTTPERKTDKKAEQDAQPKVADKLVIPDTTIDVEKINSMNADVQLDADQVVHAGFPVDRLTVSLKLQDGVLKLSPLNLGTDAGHIGMTLVMNATQSPVHMDTTMVVQNYPLQRLIGKTDSQNINTSFGAIGGNIELHGDGNSMHRMLDNADGSLSLIAQGGHISDMMIQLIGLNVAEIIGLLITKDKPVPIRCMVTDFAIQQGTMTARTVVLDTQKSIITGTGTVDLGTEIMDMRLHPKPKHVGITSLRVPFDFKGSFANPSIGPDKKALILRGGLVGALAVLLTPLTGLLGTIETGGGKDTDCNALFAQAKP